MPHSVAAESFPALVHDWPDKHHAAFMRAQYDASRPRLHLPPPPYSLSLPALPPPATSGPVTPPSDMMKLPRHPEAYPVATTAAFDEGYVSSSNPKSYAYGQMVSSRSNGSPVPRAKPPQEKTWHSPSKVLAANPGLRIPHTVPAPQADLPELTADVSLLLPLKAAANVLGYVPLLVRTWID
jgi:hypothetical protein